MIDEDTREQLEAEKASLQNELARIEEQSKIQEKGNDLFLERQLAKRKQRLNERIEELEGALAPPVDPDEPLDQIVRRIVDDKLGPLYRTLRKQEASLNDVASKNDVAELKAQLLQEIDARLAKGK